MPENENETHYFFENKKNDDLWRDTFECLDQEQSPFKSQHSNKNLNSNSSIYSNLYKKRNYDENEIKFKIQKKSILFDRNDNEVEISGKILVKGSSCITPNHLNTDIRNTDPDMDIDRDIPNTDIRMDPNTDRYVDITVLKGTSTPSFTGGVITRFSTPSDLNPTPPPESKTCELTPETKAFNPTPENEVSNPTPDFICEAFDIQIPKSQPLSRYI